MVKNSKKGFTLAELLMVVVILGLLGAIAMPKFFPQKEKAIVAEAVAMLHAIRQAELSYRLENGDYLELTQNSGDADWNKIGLDDPDSSRFTYSVDNSTVVAMRGGTDTDANYKGKVIKLKLKDGAWDRDGTDVHPLAPEN
jgi:prepilin-type N-terminal cleavage/methylation domain-containing protein